MPDSSYSRWTMSAFTILLAGVSSVALRAHANAPDCRYASGTGIIIDRTTNLIWELAYGTAMNHDAADAYCKMSTTDNAGFRLPSVEELQTIVDVHQSQPAIDSSVFTGLPSGSLLHWTSTTRAANGAFAWRVNFADGSVGVSPKNDLLFVRCVKPKPS